METKATTINAKSKFDIQRTVHRVIYSYNKSQRDALYLNFI